MADSEVNIRGMDMFVIDDVSVIGDVIFAGGFGRFDAMSGMREEVGEAVRSGLREVVAVQSTRL